MSESSHDLDLAGLDELLRPFVSRAEAELAAMLPAPPADAPDVEPAPPGAAAVAAPTSASPAALPPAFASPVLRPFVVDVTGMVPAKPGMPRAADEAMEPRAMDGAASLPPPAPVLKLSVVPTAEAAGLLDPYLARPLVAADPEGQRSVVNLGPAGSLDPDGLDLSRYVADPGALADDAGLRLAAGPSDDLYWPADPTSPSLLGLDGSLAFVNAAAPMTMSPAASPSSSSSSDSKSFVDTSAAGWAVDDGGRSLAGSPTSESQAPDPGVDDSLMERLQQLIRRLEDAADRLSQPTLRPIPPPRPFRGRVDG